MKERRREDNLVIYNYKISKKSEVENNNLNQKKSEELILNLSHRQRPFILVKIIDQDCMLLR